MTKDFVLTEQDIKKIIAKRFDCKPEDVTINCTLHMANPGYFVCQMCKPRVTDEEFEAIVRIKEEPI